MAIYTARRRIAVVGLGNSGKTVFITSLINQLQNPQSTFDLGKGDIRKFEEFRSAAESAFAYDRYRKRMAHNSEWPEKTTDQSRYCCRFELSNEWIGDYMLEFVDLPGERFADAGMLKFTFDEWSNHTLNWMQDDPGYKKHADPYLTALGQGNLRESDVILTYKKSLFQLAQVYKPMISPSTFLLDLQGTQATTPEPTETIDDVIGSRYVGINKDAQFAPLPACMIAKQPALASTFRERYQRYQEEVVKRFGHALKNCDGLIILVDVLHVLQAGPGMVDDIRTIVKSIFTYVGGRSAFWRRVLDPLTVLLPNEWRPGDIRKISIVATKADLVLERDMDNLDKILQDMFSGIDTHLEGVEIRYFHVSAVVSARPHGSDSLRGRCVFDINGKKRSPQEPEEVFTPSAVPATVPDDFPPGTFHFCDVYPEVPKASYRPPKQLNLDELLKFHLF